MSGFDGNIERLRKTCALRAFIIRFHSAFLMKSRPMEVEIRIVLATCTPLAGWLSSYCENFSLE
jgi:hypothetical protein